MRVLGVESSCDETAAAVVEDGCRLLNNIVQSQIDIHSVFGGVVPEVAARSHLEVILPVIDKAVLESYLNCHPELVSGSSEFISKIPKQVRNDICIRNDISKKAWDEIDAIACTTMPGLVGSLLIGSLTARTLALIKNKPFYPINHVEAHVYANFLCKDSDPQPSHESSNFPDNLSKDSLSSVSTNLFPHGAPDKNSRKLYRENWSDEGEVGGSGQTAENTPKFPMLALIVSGGHSQIVLFRNHGDYMLIGQTQDDAVGEAFDKVAKILGLPYPGGPSIAKAAENGDPNAYNFPKAKMSNKYDFSFSGLKTAVLRAVQTECGQDHTFPSTDLPTLLSEAQRNNFAASFQKIAVETLIDKIIAAYEEFQPKSVVIAGGVAANQELRRELAERLPIEITYPAPALCTDNAAMVASLGYFVAAKIPPSDPRTTEVNPSISMTQTAWNTL